MHPYPFCILYQLFCILYFGNGVIHHDASSSILPHHLYPPLIQYGWTIDGDEYRHYNDDDDDNCDNTMEQTDDVPNSSKNQPGDVEGGSKTDRVKLHISLQNTAGVAQVVEL